MKIMNFNQKPQGLRVVMVNVLGEADGSTWITAKFSNGDVIREVFRPELFEALREAWNTGNEYVPGYRTTLPGEFVNLQTYNEEYYGR